MRVFLCILAAAVGMLLLAAEIPQPALVFITIGQSNADGSAFPDPAEDARLRSWYDSPANPHMAKIWYRACYVENCEPNALGDKGRIVRDAPADKKDAEPGWMDLWYRNENNLGRTAMNMIHSCGTWSKGKGPWQAQNRRGMEPELGRLLQDSLTGVPVYFLKLGASGTYISEWADPQADNNWKYFTDKILHPALEDIRLRGQEPIVSGVWWMQGCADLKRDSAYYRERLDTLVTRLNYVLPRPSMCEVNGNSLPVPFLLGHVVKPGENPDAPDASLEFGQGVRDAQDALAAERPGVIIIDTAPLSFQYEEGFGGHLHWDHKGVNRLAHLLLPHVLRAWRERTEYKSVQR